MDADEQAARIRRQAILLTAGVVMVIVAVAAAIVVPAVLDGWRAYGR